MQHIESKFFVLIVILLAIGLTYLLAPILTPFLTGALLAYLADPLVTKLVKLKLPRLVSVIIVFCLFFAVLILLILLLIPLIQKQLESLAVVIPNVILWVQKSILPWLELKLGFSEEIINVESLKTILIQNWTKANGVANWLFQTTLHSGFRVMEWLVNLILIPVVTFYLLCDWRKLIQGFRNILPRRIAPTVIELLAECDTVLSAFFRGQLLVMLALGIIYSVGLTLMGLQIGLLIGLICGVLSIVPYLGSIVGIVIATIAGLVQFGTFSSVLLIWLIFAVSHIVDNAFLTPKLVGDRIGLHPVIVIFAVLAGGSLFGFLGVLLALPVAALIMVWVRFLYKKYRHSKLYQA